jgi:hypothetical protein
VACRGLCPNFLWKSRSSPVLARVYTCLKRYKMERARRSFGEELKPGIVTEIEEG